MRFPNPSDRAWLGVGLISLGAAAAVLLLFGGERTAGPSVLASGGGGWLAARLYLEARGGDARLLDLPFDEAVDGGLGPVLATAFPWRRWASEDEFLPLRGWVRRGGVLVVAYSGDDDARSEDGLLGQLGLELERVRADPPWGPVAWRRHQLEEWSLEPVAAGSEVRPVVVRAPHFAPAPAEGDRVLYRRRDGGRPLVFSRREGKGRLVVLPAEALANARLGRGGSADLLESLLAGLGSSWTFDEYHHGLVRPESLTSALPPGVFDLFLVHLAALYAAGIWNVARRFGPPWREPRARSGSAASFLLGLGGLHHRLGHHADAARLLLARVRELDPHLVLPRELEDRAAGADAAELVALAREVAGRRRARRRGASVVGEGP